MPYDIIIAAAILAAFTTGMVVGQWLLKKENQLEEIDEYD
jgi:hypothetical protein